MATCSGDLVNAPVNSYDDYLIDAVIFNMYLIKWSKEMWELYFIVWIGEKVQLLLLS